MSYGLSYRYQPLSLARGRGAIGNAPLPLQIAGSRGEINAIEGGAITSSNQKQTGRSRHYIGSKDQSELYIGMNGYFVDTATSGNFWTCFEVNATNSYKLKGSVTINGLVVPLKWGGSTQTLVEAGSLLTLPDALLPAQFGLATFPAQQEYWVKLEREYEIGQKAMFHQTASNSPTIAGESYFVGPLSATTHLESAGALSTTGGWTQQAHVWLPFCTIGRPVNKMMSNISFGASIENGVGDGQGDGLNGAGGYYRRMFANVNGKKLARLHLAKSGETIKSWLANSAKRRHMLQYATHVHSGHGGNDYSTSETLANTQNRWVQAWELMKALGAWVEHYGLSPKTNGTWATLEGQTPRVGYEVGGAWRDAGNVFCAAQVVSNPHIDGFTNLGDVQTDPTARDKWRVDLGIPTTDGTHPSAVVAAAMATAAAIRVEALRAAYEDA